MASSSNDKYMPIKLSRRWSTLSEMDSPITHEDGRVAGARLKRKIGLFSATAVVISSVIGSGIFVSPSLVFVHSGSVGADLLVWLTAGVMAVIQAVCMAELTTLLPASGGEYEFLSAAGDTLGRPGDFVSFLYVWVRILMGDPLSAALQGLGFASYALRLVYPSCEPPYAVTVLVAVSFVSLATALNAASVGKSARLQNVLVVIKVALLLSIVCSAVVAWVTGANHLKGPFFSEETTAWGLAHAYVVVSLTMDGGAAVCAIAEEVKNPSRNLPWAFILGMLAVAFLYMLTNFAYFIVLEHSAIAASDAVALTFAIESWGAAGAVIIPVVVSVSVFGALSAGIFSSSRLSFAAARRGHLPAVLSSISVTSSVPVTSVIFRGVTAAMFTFVGSVEVAINGIMFFVAFFNLFILLSLVRLRFTMTNVRRVIKAPYLFVALSFAGSLVIVVANVADSADCLMFVLMGGIIVSGFVVYFICHVKKCVMPGIMTLSLFVQKLLLCQPCDQRAYKEKKAAVVHQHRKRTELTAST
ncbi:Y+L amino acid transporter 2-like [Haemaphysalis longicornis]